MMPTDSYEAVVVEVLSERLGLPMEGVPGGVNASLFAPVSAGGLELDSLASLEIVSALSERFSLPFDDMEPEDFQSISTLAAYLRRRGATDHVEH
jgi:acyl carrier protein